MKKTLLAVALTAASMTAIADVKLSGHAATQAGDLSDLNGSDGISVSGYGASGSRFRMEFGQEVNGITYGGKLEVGVSSGLSTRVNEVTAAGSFGKVSLGQGSTAFDGVSEASFNRSAGAYNLDAYDNGSSLQTTANEFGLANFGFGGHLDGGRQDRIKYDSPSFNGFAFSASYDDNDVTEEAAAVAGAGGDDTSFHVRYANDIVKVQYGVTSVDAADSDKTAASIAGKMGNINAQIQFYSEEDGSNSDKDQTRFAVGYDMDKYAFTVAYTMDEQDAANGTSTTDADSIGLSVSYFPTKGVSLFAGVKRFSDDSDATEAYNVANPTFKVDDSATGVVLGAKITF